MVRAAPPLALFALLAACHRAPETPKATEAWIRLPAVAGQPAAGYFTLHGSRTAERLIKVESALAGSAQLHESMTGMGGMAGMAPLAGVDLPAGGTVIFAPNGRHVMLSGLDPVVKPGTAVPLRLGFASGRTAEAEAKTVSAGDDAPY